MGLAEVVDRGADHDRVPLRVAQQTVRTVLGWRDNAAPEVGVHVLMGGESVDEHEWKSAPERTQIFVGTQDMVLSRLLMRGFGEARAAWPMSFGLLHAGVQFVFDEVQLMGPGLPTSLQLQGCVSRWVSRCRAGACGCRPRSTPRASRRWTFGVSYGSSS